MRFPNIRNMSAFVLLCAASIAQAADTAPPQAGKWVKAPSQSKGSDSLSLSLTAEKPVKGWMKTYVPVLTIQCSQGKADVYLQVGMGLEVTTIDQQIVRVRFDDGKMTTQRWREATNETITARDGVGVIRQLAQSQKFMLEFTPFGSPPAQAEFVVSGLSAYMPQMAGACWKK